MNVMIYSTNRNYKIMKALKGEIDYMLIIIAICFISEKDKEKNR